MSATKKTEVAATEAATAEAVEMVKLVPKVSLGVKGSTTGDGHREIVVNKTGSEAVDRVSVYNLPKCVTTKKSAIRNDLMRKLAKIADENGGQVVRKGDAKAVPSEVYVPNTDEVNAKVTKAIATVLAGGKTKVKKAIEDNFGNWGDMIRTMNEKRSIFGKVDLPDTQDELLKGIVVDVTSSNASLDAKRAEVAAKQRAAKALEAKAKADEDCKAAKAELRELKKRLNAVAKLEKENEKLKAELARLKAGGSTADGKAPTTGKSTGRKGRNKGGNAPAPAEVKKTVTGSRKGRNGKPVACPSPEVTKAVADKRKKSA